MAVPTETQTLPYAPPNPDRRLPVLVLLAGFVSTAITLTALHFVQEHVEIDIMSFTVKLIFPLGALFVGFLAGLGFGIAAYVLNVRVRGWLIGVILLMQIWSYFAANYIEFRAQGPLVSVATGKRIGFFEYYHLVTVHMTKERDTVGSRNNGSEPAVEELGTSAYFYRVLGILGFSLAGIIIPAVQRKLPYCPLCQQYMKSKNLLKLPATAKQPGVRLRSKFSLDTPEHKEQLEHAINTLKRTTELLLAGDINAMRGEIQANNAKIPSRVPLFASLDLTYCRTCYQGKYAASLKNNGNYQSSLAGIIAQGDVPPAYLLPAVDPSVSVDTVPKDSDAASPEQPV